MRKRRPKNEDLGVKVATAETVATVATAGASPRPTV